MDANSYEIQARNRAPITYEFTNTAAAAINSMLEPVNTPRRDPWSSGGRAKDLRNTGCGLWDPGEVWASNSKYYCKSKQEVATRARELMQIHTKASPKLGSHSV